MVTNHIKQYELAYKENEVRLCSTVQVDEKLYGSLYGVGAPAKYLVLTNQEMASSETEEWGAERPKLTDAQLEAGMMSQNVEISEQLEEAGTRDCANSEEDEDLAEAFETYFYYFMIFFDLSFSFSDSHRILSV
ncbi:phosphoribosyl-ATP pyrophosphatase [Trichinella spiralis]|nr:phosphoribosyl-ATP pyrophosphatase [Trichinella spiralis]